MENYAGKSVTVTPFKKLKIMSRVGSKKKLTKLETQR